MSLDDLARFEPRGFPNSEEGDAFMVRSDHGDYVSHIAAVSAIKKISEQCLALETALKFYADPDTYEQNQEPPFQGGFTPIEKDGGSCARTALLAHQTQNYTLDDVKRQVRLELIKEVLTAIYEGKVKEGLVDVRFDFAENTPKDSYYEEVFKMQMAVLAGKSSTLCFGDSTLTEDQLNQISESEAKLHGDKQKADGSNDTGHVYSKLELESSISAVVDKIVELCRDQAKSDYDYASRYEDESDRYIFKAERAQTLADMIEEKIKPADFC